MSVAADFAAVRTDVVAFLTDALARARSPWTAAMVPASIYLVGIWLDSATTYFVDAIPGIVEGNPFAAAGMELFGGSAAGGAQTFMLMALLLLTPPAIVLAGRPTTVFTRGAWITILGLGIAKFGIGLSNLVLIAQVTGLLR